MRKIRIIPRLDIKGPNVVKGVQTEGLHIVGNPADLAKAYYHSGADELIYMDIVASLYGRNVDYNIVRSVSNQIFIPLTVGGGIRSIHDIHAVLSNGADKVAINTHAVKNPFFLNEAVQVFGSQCIVLSIEAKKNTSGWEVYTDGGRERTGKDAVEWAKEAVKIGVGEILVMSIDNDGTKNGYDLELLASITSISPVPVIVHGGAKNTDSLKVAVERGSDACALSSILHYKETNISSLKKNLKKHKINVR